MKFPEITDDLSIISKLGDNPGSDNGLTAAGLKAKFDEAGLILQDYINQTLVKTLNESFEAGDNHPSDGLNMNGAINMNRNPLQNLRDPESDGEAVSLGFAKGNFVPNTRKINGKALDRNISLSAADVNARSSTWLPTIAEIGAAPAGFGLGSTVKDITAAELDTTKGNGWYRIAGDSLAIGGTTFSDMFVHVKKYSNSYFVQDVYPMAARCKIVRWYTNGTWYEEWDNPPFVEGIEYRTTDRIGNKAVYKKKDSSGAILYRLDGEDTWNKYNVLAGAIGFNRVLTSDDDLDKIRADGVYTYITDKRPSNAPFDNAAVVFVFGSNNTTTQKVQFVFRYGGAGQGKFRVLYNDTWKEWADFGGLIEDGVYGGCYYRYVDGVKEWVSPPMVPNTEYRTADRRGGKVVYTKLINVGAIAAEGNLGVSTGLSGGTYLDFTVRFLESSGDVTCGAVLFTDNSLTAYAWISPSEKKCIIRTIKECPGCTAQVIFKYTKS